MAAEERAYAVVVTVHDDGLLAVVSAGAARAAEGAQVGIVHCPDAGDAVATLREAIERGARGLPVLGLVSHGTLPTLTADALALLTDPALHDLHVAVPAFEDDETRRALWDQLRSARVEERHQLVEVDGGPVAADTAGPSELAAAAAGILAGRMAAANRVWDRMKPERGLRLPPRRV
jgi:hypothetical protein